MVSGEPFTRTESLILFLVYAVVIGAVFAVLGFVAELWEKRNKNSQERG